MEVEKGACDVGPCGEVGGVDSGRGLPLAGGDEGAGGFGVGAVIGALPLEEAGQGLELGGGRLPLEGLVPCPADARDVVAGGIAEDASGEGLGGLDVRRVVEEDEGLLGDVGAGAVGGAFLAGGGVEGEHGGVDEGALPPCVEAAAVLAGAVGGVVAALGGS